MKNVSKVLFSTVVLTLMVGCGKKDSGHGKRPQMIQAEKDPITSEEGYFKAELIPLNAHLTGDVTGKATLAINSGQLNAEVGVSGLAEGVVYSQHIHVADACPTLASDVNKDGVIDAVEGEESYGKALIPLDGDINSQLAGLEVFPSADVAGKYFYSRAASMKDMMDDLLLKDLDYDDPFIKMDGTKLTLTGRHVVIYGVPETAVLPQSVQTRYGKKSHESIPIACGTFAKVDALEEGNTSNGSKE